MRGDQGVVFVSFLETVYASKDYLLINLIICLNF